MTDSRDPAEETGRIDELVTALAGKDAIAPQGARHALEAAGSAAVGALAAALEDDRKQVRWEAAKALVRVADAGAASALVARLGDDDSGVRWLAAEALIAVGSDSLPPLLKALTERERPDHLFEGAHHVLHSLRKTDLGDTVQPVLAAIEETSREVSVPVAAYDALHRLEEHGP